MNQYDKCMFATLPLAVGMAVMGCAVPACAHTLAPAASSGTPASSPIGYATDSRTYTMVCEIAQASSQASIDAAVAVTGECPLRLVRA